MRPIKSLAALLMVASFSGPALAETEVVAATWLPPQHQYSRYLYNYWAERVPEYDQSLKVRVELGSPRVTALGNLSEIADGLVDVSGHFAQYTPSDLPIANAAEELGMTFEDPRAIIATAAEFNMTDPAQQAEWKAKGVVFGSSYTTNHYKLICNTPITDLSQIEGAKLRLPGRAPAEWANGVGAVTVSFNTNEQYGALDKGALTCTTTTAADAYVRKLYEVAPHITDMPITLFWAGLGHGYNPDTWKKLSVEQRKALLYAEADAMAALIVDGTLLEEVEAEEKLKAKGVTFHKPAGDLSGSLAAFKAAQPGKAVPIVQEKFGVADAEDLLNRFQGTLDKWTGLLADVPLEDKAALAALMKSEIIDKLDLSTYGVN
ncbi:TRAP transporter substrate-binding protein DctP [Hoeflea prorocentri]|uniref:TRAP transporter substrate-binding protein DctP n=1 Tax=Hoeflea prorocentri TaxID=1922333 RepID=A0A9X3ZIT5_9HYPH|nr:TRAP transporter substrate-binding protein DctP [Hoeflea prorocentri]MCY6382201.1 TRAP transporter substrate-binding protein DctP [Hoeflea prorocentri]MDA5400001.1 TRAP transporter substrate-binding protein DctP [Hoeflea prorocentri]